MYEQDSTSYPLTKSSNSRKKKQKKEVETISSDFLGFIPPSSESQQEYIPRPRNKRKQTNQRKAQRKFNFRNKHHFILEAGSITNEEMAKFQGITPVEWELIRQVIFTVGFNHPITCPICLNGTSQITDPLITACGHVFCSPCILRHIRVSKKQFHCPVCNEFVNKNELKPCVLIGYKPIGDNKLSFVLRARSQGSNTVHDTQTLRQDFYFSKFIRATNQYLLQQLFKQKVVLENHLKQYISEGQQQNIPFITEAMDLVNEKILSVKLELSYPKKKNKKEETFEGKFYTTMTQLQKSKSFYFYQEEFGRLIFLHPICNHYLCQEFLSNDQLPLVINSTLQYKESIQLDSKTLRRYKYLNHLPLDSQILFAEINMSNFLQKATLDLYNKQMGRHKDRIRERQQQDMKRNDEIINKRLAKKVAKEKYEYVILPVDDQIKDLKSCNKDENFPSLPSQPRLIEQMSEPIPELILKEPSKNISNVEFDFPQINAEKSSNKNPKKGKGKKGKKYEQVDITQMMFQPPQEDD